MSSLRLPSRVSRGTGLSLPAVSTYPGLFNAYTRSPGDFLARNAYRNRAKSSARGSLSRLARATFHLLRRSPQPRPHSAVDRKRIYSSCGKVNEPAMVRKLAMTKQPREHRKNQLRNGLVNIWFLPDQGRRCATRR